MAGQTHGVVHAERSRRGRSAAVILIAGALLLLLVGRPAEAQETGWEITEYDVEIVMAPDGSFTVEETITAVFSEERRGILRTIPTRYSFDEDRDRLVEIVGPSVTTSEGTPDALHVDRRSAEVEMRVGDADRWITGSHTYRIHYGVRGAMNRFETHDELYWNVTGEGWPVPIGRVRARVTGAPIVEATCYAGWRGTGGLCGQISAEDDDARFGHPTLHPGEGMTIVVAFEPGAIDVPPPVLEHRWTLGRAFIGSPWAIPLTVLVALGVLVWFVRLLAREGRDRVTRGDRTVDGRVDDQAGVHRRWVNPRAVPVRFRPPDGLRPAQLGVIIDERVDPVEVSATIVDLAVRGHLTIREETTRRILRSRSEWHLRRRPDPGGEALLPFEQRLLDGLFDPSLLEEDEVALSDLAGSFHSDYRAVRDRLYDDTVERGWFMRSPQSTRDRWIAIGSVWTVAAGLLVAGLATTTTFALAGMPLFVLGVAIVAAHRWMPHRTPEGSRVLDETLGFRDFISTAEAGRAEFAEDEGIFTSYLPYAIVFGVVDRWARAFERLGDEAATSGTGVWYVGPHGRFPGVGGLASGLSEMSSVAGSSLSQTPASSGSSGFGGGGGSVGGGFGGGGGGSW